MLTREEQTRLDELRDLENLTADEQQEIVALEEKEPLDPNQDEFDQAWDNNDFDAPAEDQPAGDQDKAGQSNEANTDSEQDDPNNPDNGSDNPATGMGDSSENEETPEQQIAKLKADLAKEKQVSASWKGRVEAINKVKTDDKLKKGSKPGQGESDNDLPENEDDPELSDFFKEFPDLKSPFTKLVRREVEKAVSDVKQTVGRVQETLQEDAGVKHIAAISTAHPDWETIRDSGDLDAWINSQPGYLQPRLWEVYQTGDTGEVIEMFDSYKKETGKGKSTINPTSRTDSKLKRRKAMEAVPASSAGARKPKGKPDKDDFDAAWEYFSEAESKK